MTQSYLKLRVDKCYTREIKFPVIVAPKILQLSFAIMASVTGEVGHFGEAQMKVRINLKKFRLRNKFAAFHIWQVNTHLGFNLTDSHCWAWNNTWPGSFWKWLATFKAKLSLPNLPGSVWLLLSASVGTQAYIFVDIYIQRLYALIEPLLIEHAYRTPCMLTNKVVPVSACFA